MSRTSPRKYQQTHPWLTFRLDLRPAPWHLWTQLGECQSKCQHISEVPLKVGTARKLYRLYLAKGALGSAAIEGNTLTEAEVVQHLRKKLTLPPSRAYVAAEVESIVSLCEEAVESLQAGKSLALTRERIQEINRRVLGAAPPQEGVTPGRVRNAEVGVARYRGAPHEDCEYLLDRLCEWIEGPDFRPPREDARLVFAMMKAVVAHLYFEWIHPFEDGNGRTGRMIEFRILVASGVPAPCAHLLSNHYNLTRDEYYRQLDSASRGGGDVLPFLAYAVQGLLDGLRVQLKLIWEQQWDVAWREYIHEHRAFRDKKSDASRRQRALLLDLSAAPEPVPTVRIPELTPRLARHYAVVSEKTLARDLAMLEKEQLVEKTGSGYRALKERILAFRPPVAGRA